MHRLVRTLRSAPIFAVECAVRLYQVAVSPLLVGHCKFIPSCSDYFIQAVREWGVIRGGWLGIRRLARCTPGGIGGIDPVPAKPKHQS